MAIFKRNAAAHGGHIWVESKEGVGSRFSFSIPGKTLRQRVYIRVTAAPKWRNSAFRTQLTFTSGVDIVYLARPDLFEPVAKFERAITIGY